MKLTLEERQYLRNELIKICKMEPKVREMREYIQHGETSTFSHCVAVTYVSFWLHKRIFHCKHEKDLIRASLLHDFYLYDWHDQDDKRNPLHGFYHPGIALKNARACFLLTAVEEDAIEKHMWPLTFMKFPKYKESIVVSLSDKICSTMETIHCPVKVRL